MNNTTDKEILPEIRPVYEAMKARVMSKLESNPHNIRAHKLDHVILNSVKLTLELHVRRTPDGLEEQFEYYDYRYFHRRVDVKKPVSG